MRSLSLGVHNALMLGDHKYVLVLEDDMVFSEQAKESLEAALKKEYPLLWYSIPSKRVIEHSKKNFKRYLYSALILWTALLWSNLNSEGDFKKLCLTLFD